MKKLNKFLTMNYSRATTAITLTMSALFLTPVHAALPNITVGTLNQDLFCPIFGVMFMVLIAVSVIMIIWAAYLFVIAQEDADKVTKARKTITYAAVAIVVAIIARGFPTLIGSIFPGVGVASSC